MKKNDGFSATKLRQLLVEYGEPERYLVAFSGGLDSCVLLHALAQNRPFKHAKLQAVHINHGLQGDANDWQDFCAHFCHQRDIDFISKSVDGSPSSGDSLEAWARDQRYRILSDLLIPGDLLLTAHHLDDQAETVLQRLLRGAGVRGLSAMQHQRKFSEGTLMRPLLTIERSELQRFAEMEDVQWIEDPSNQDQSYDRNFLRHDILPRLQQRWHNGNRLLARSASHLEESTQLLDELARIDLLLKEEQDIPDFLSVTILQNLSRARALNVLHYWLRCQSLPTPAWHQQEQLFQDLLHAREDAQPRVRWTGVELRRYQQQIFVVPELPVHDSSRQYAWEWKQSLGLPTGIISTHSCIGKGIKQSVLPNRLTIRFRQGGERCRLPGRPERSLKKILQESDIPPWQRQHLPLVYLNNTLIAVADRWVCDGYQATPETSGVQIVWSPDV